MTVRGSCAERALLLGAPAPSPPGVTVGVGVVIVWQATKTRARASKARRFMAADSISRLCVLCSRRFRDHRVHELPGAVPVRRGSLRAQTVEEDQVREVPDRLRDP